jgi:hypothetical protein
VSVERADVGAAINGKITVTHKVSVLMLEPARVGLQLKPAPAAASARQQLYSLATSEQFINNADDEARGWLTNPFGMRDLTQETLESQGRGGPFPGDKALFAFSIYSDPSLKLKAGTAAFTCLYEFTRNAFCDATYQLKRGTILASGTVSFDAGTFSLAITGGTGSYARSSGELTSSPGPNKTQLISIAGS